MIRTHLEDQVALVTGGARGIGAAIASRLAAGGAHVIVNYRGSEDDANAVVTAIHAAGGSAEALQADVADAQATETLFRGVFSEHGRLDILVNNAGVAKDALLATMRDRDWQKVIDVNLGGLQRCTRLALQRMMPARSGCIVNLSSIQALRGGRGQANYAAAKAGVLGLTRAAALEVADRGIRINAVLPGFIETDMTAMIQRRAGDEVLARIPAGRFGTPEDVAGLVLFLCSEDAAYITGQAFTVDGGMSIA
ncbi:MAG: 3-oxoacyl-ACP reductase FabG [Planctomycetota bacterium]|nr:3-oxoacyl-ACP reductase FabG [Planctomycetota bacterium]